MNGFSHIELAEALEACNEQISMTLGDGTLVSRHIETLQTEFANDLGLIMATGMSVAGLKAVLKEV